MIEASQLNDTRIEMQEMACMPIFDKNTLITKLVIFFIASILNRTYYFNGTSYNFSRYGIDFDWEQFSLCMPCDSKNAVKYNNLTCRLIHSFKAIFNNTLYKLPQLLMSCHSAMLDASHLCEHCELIEFTNRMRKHVGDLRVAFPCTSEEKAKSCPAPQEADLVDEILNNLTSILEAGLDVNEFDDENKPLIIKNGRLVDDVEIELPLEKIELYEKERVELVCDLKWSVFRRNRLQFLVNRSTIDPILMYKATEGRIQIRKTKMIFYRLHGNDSGHYMCSDGFEIQLNVELKVQNFHGILDWRDPFGAIKISSIVSFLIYFVVVVYKFLTRYSIYDPL